MGPDGGLDGPTDVAIDLMPDLPRDAAADGPATPVCPKAGWTVMPSPTKESLSGVWGSSAADVFAVGKGGTILRYDGTSWTAMSSGTAEDLHAVMGTGPKNVFAVGANGTVLRYDGTSWTPFPSAIDKDLHALWVISSDLYVVGELGWAYHWDGTSWTEEKVDSGTLVGVFGTSKSDVVAIGTSGWYRFDGVMWNKGFITGADSLRAIWGDDTALFVVGTAWGATGVALIKRYEAGQLTTVPAGTFKPLRAVWGSPTDALSPDGPADVIAVGEGGTALYYDGSQWTELQTGTLADLSGVWRSADNEAFAVGELGTILHHRGPWRHLERKTTKWLRGVWGSGPSEVVVVGDDGAVLRFDGVAWTVESAGQGTLEDIWGDGSGTLYALQRWGNPQAGLVTRYTVSGGSWGSFHTSDRILFGIWGASAPDLSLFVAAQDRIERYAQGAWSEHGASGTFRDVWGAGPADVYAVGDQGKVLHFDGSGWTLDSATGTTEDLHGVTGNGGKLYVVGASGTVLENKPSWKPMISGVTCKLSKVWADGSDVFAVGDRGTIIRHDGTEWRSTVTGTSLPLQAVWGSDAKDVYAVGASGVMLHWCGE